KVPGRRAPGDVDVARRRYDRECVGFIVIAAPQVRRLLERSQVAVQARDERVAPQTPTGGALGATARSWEIGGVRDAGDVDVARRRRDREPPLHLVVLAAAEVGGLPEHGEPGVQPRDETIKESAGSPLGAADGAREVG